LVASAVIDCPPCHEEAPSINAFVNRQAAQLRVWVPVYRLAGEADCPDADNWQALYGYDAAHVFAREEALRLGMELQRFYALIDPDTRQVVFTTNTWALAETLTEEWLANWGKLGVRLGDAPRVWPNPLSPGVAPELAWYATAPGEAVLRVMDTHGRLLRTEALPHGTGEVQHTLTGLADLPQGIYLLQLQSQGQMFSLRLVR
jgi:hypothetical protein